MDIALLKTFLEVAKLRHFGKAADSLFVTQSAVSARIKLLEATLGVELFQRRRNDIQLTPAGQRLQRHADTIVNGWERARQELALDSAQTRSLAVGFVVDLWSVLVRDWVSEIIQSQPEVSLVLHALPQRGLGDRLLAGNLDLAILFEPLQSPELTVRQVADMPLVLTASEPDRSPRQALGEGYVYVDWGEAFSVTHAQQHEGCDPPRVQLNLGTLAADLVRHQGGSAYLPEQELTGEAAGLYPVDEDAIIERPVYAVFATDHAERKLLADLVKRLRAG